MESKVKMDTKTKARLKDFLIKSRRRQEMYKTPEQVTQFIAFKRACNARAHKIVEEFLETTTNERLLDALKSISQGHWDDICEERSILDLCGYPTCDKKLGTVPNQKYHINTIVNKIYDISWRKHFCSRECFVASKYVREQLNSSLFWFHDRDENQEYKLWTPETENHGNDLCRTNSQSSSDDKSSICSQLTTDSDMSIHVGYTDSSSTTTPYQSDTEGGVKINEYFSDSSMDNGQNAHAKKTEYKNVYFTRKSEKIEDVEESAGDELNSEILQEFADKIKIVNEKHLNEPKHKLVTLANTHFIDQYEKKVQSGVFNENVKIDEVAKNINKYSDDEIIKIIDKRRKDYTTKNQDWEELSESSDVEVVDDSEKNITNIQNQSSNASTQSESTRDGDNKENEFKIKFVYNESPEHITNVVNAGEYLAEINFDDESLKLNEIQMFAPKSHYYSAIEDRYTPIKTDILGNSVCDDYMFMPPNFVTGNDIDDSQFMIVEAKAKNIIEKKIDFTPKYSSPLDNLEVQSEKIYDKRQEMELNDQIKYTSKPSDKQLEINKEFVQKAIKNEDLLSGLHKTLKEHGKTQIPEETCIIESSDGHVHHYEVYEHTPVTIPSVVESTLQQWITIDTIIFLVGKSKVHKYLLKYGKNINEMKKINIQEIEHYEQYKRLCQKINVVDHEIMNDWEREDTEWKDDLKPVPSYAALKEDSRRLFIKVKSFYDGETHIPTGLLNGVDTPDTDITTGDEKDPYYLPPSDRHDQIILRRRIVLNTLQPMVADVFRECRIKDFDICSDVREFVHTCKLDADNILFSPTQKRLLAYVIIHMIAIKEETLATALSQEYRVWYFKNMLSSYMMNLDELNRLIERVTNIENLLKTKFK